VPKPGHVTWLKIATILLLGFALAPNPYGFYVLLRWLSCPVFLYLALSAYEAKSRSWVWLYGVSAGLYNPIMPPHLGRNIWSVVNIATIVLLFISFARDNLKANKNLR